MKELNFFLLAEYLIQQAKNIVHLDGILISNELINLEDLLKVFYLSLVDGVGDQFKHDA